MIKNVILAKTMRRIFCGSVFVFLMLIGMGLAEDVGKKSIASEAAQPQIAVEVNVVRMNADLVRTLIGTMSAGKGNPEFSGDIVNKIWESVADRKAAHIHALKGVVKNGESGQQSHEEELSLVTDYTVEGDKVKPVLAPRQIGGIMNFKASVENNGLVGITMAYDFTDAPRPIKTAELRIKGFEKPFRIDIPTIIHNSIHTSLEIKDGATVLLGVFDAPSEESKCFRDVVFLSLKVLNSSSQGH